MARGVAGTRKRTHAAGKATRLTREVANRINRDGDTPLDTMVNNMIYWKRQSEKLTRDTEKMMARLLDMDLNKLEDLSGEVALLNKLMSKMFYAREQSQSCAVDAAPYCHPRLASITVDKPPVDEEIIVTVEIGSEPPEHIRQAQLRGSTVIENETAEEAAVQ